MENHDTFNISNILEIENWILVGAALLKMAIFFWPVILVAAVFVYLDYAKEIENER